MPKCIFVVVSLVLALTFISFAADDPFAGTWRLVPANPKTVKEKDRETITLIVDGETFDWFYGDRHYLKAKFDGKEYAVDGWYGGYLTYRLKHIDAQTIEMKQAPLGPNDFTILWQVKGNTLIETRKVSGAMSRKDVIVYERIN